MDKNHPEVTSKSGVLIINLGTPDSTIGGISESI